jgi:SAM-dependent methyltransferase
VQESGNYFKAHAEKEYYRSYPALTPSPQDLDRLEVDLHHWVPGFPDFFKGKLVLDLGAGTAPLGTLISQRHSPKKVVSLELVLHRLHAATPWTKSLSVFSLICGNIFTLPFKDQSFDVVIANSVLHHLPNISQAISEIARVLRFGGLFIGREPNFNNRLLRLIFFKWISHTLNEYPLRAQEIVSTFSRYYCLCNIHYFWRRLPFLRHPILSIAMSVRAQRLA